MLTFRMALTSKIIMWVLVSHPSQAGNWLELLLWESGPIAPEFQLVIGRQEVRLHAENTNLKQGNF
jgi:hypothetical protein